MLNLEREIAAAGLDSATAARLAAIERREVVSVGAELRLLMWLGVALVTAGVGTLLARNVDRIGHATLMAAIGVAAAGCYAFAWRGRLAGGAAGERELAPVGDYVLLLGALLVSADLAYAEARFGVFGGAWKGHLALLAGLHAAAAYAYGSRLVLSLAIVALAGAFGVEREGELLSRGAGDAAARLAGAAAACAVWRIVHGRASRLARFELPLEQAALHLAMLATIVAIFDDSLRLLALALLVGLAVLAAAHGVRSRRESFLVFAALYLVFGIDAAFAIEAGSPTLLFGWIALTTPAAIVALVVLHRRWKARFA